MSKEIKEVPFEQWTRKEKRTATLVHQGSRITVLAYIGRMNAFLNSRYKATAYGKPVNHYEQMLSRYMEKGIKAVEEYLDLFRDATIQQQKDLDTWRGETAVLDVLQAAKKIDEIVANGKNSA